MTSFSPWLAAHTAWLVMLIGGFATLALYSILYKENKVYRLAEHIYLGLATGYLIATAWTDILEPKWWKPMVEKGQWVYIGMLLIALLYYFIYIDKMQWIARLGIGFFLGIASGRAFQEFCNDVWPQISTAFKPFIPHGAVAAANGHPAIPPLNVPDAINNFIFMFILLTVMSYFFFSFEQKHPIMRRSAQTGRWVMMFAFGAIFGSTVMGRLALLIDRVDYLLNDFGASLISTTSPPPAATQNTGKWIMFIVLIILSAVILSLVRKNQGTEGGEGTES
jgi:hypothetical protein